MEVALGEVFSGVFSVRLAPTLGLIWYKVP